MVLSSSPRTSSSTRTTEALKCPRGMRWLLFGMVFFLFGVAIGSFWSVERWYLQEDYLRGVNLEQALVASTVGSASLAALLPDWRMNLDCSVYSRDCVMRKVQGQINTYAEYPFRFAEKYNQRYEWQEKLPERWKESLQEHVPIDSLVEKPGKEDPAIQECVQKALKMSVDEQLDQLLSSLKRVNNMVSFTISDILYASDMMQDVYEMAHQVVGFRDAFFMVAIDVATMELACEYNYPFLAWPQQQEEGSLKKNVANTKFDISYELTKRRQDFFFFEMDVWFVKSPLTMIREQTEDILFSGHQNNPNAANIGVYSVFANERSEEYLKICIEMLQQSPDTHDQLVMQQVGWFLDALHQGKPLKYSGKFKEPLPKIPNFQHPDTTLGRFVPYQIATDERPVTTEGTIAIHTLCGAPLRNPHGKKQIAKELGAWYGSGDYFSNNNRYLWVDGHVWNGLSMAMSWPGFHPWAAYHRLEHLQWMIAVTIALARRARRIWVMPKVLHDAGIHFLWTILDFESVESLVEVRETNFPVNHKAHNRGVNPYHTVARTALGYQDKIFVQTDATDTHTDRILAWNSSTYEHSTSPLDVWFALHTSIPEVENAQLLLAGLPVTYEDVLRFQTRARDKRQQLGVAEKEIVHVWKKLKWCEWQFLGRDLDKVVGRAAADWDCYLNGNPAHQL